MDSYKEMRAIDRQSKIKKFRMPESPYKIKRENWNGKYVAVARKKGKIVTWKKYSPKIPLKELKENFRKSNFVSFRENIKGYRLKKVVEISDYSNVPSKPRSGKYQYVIRGVYAGKEITVRSDSFSVSVPKNTARQEALERFYSELSRVEGYGYDEDMGRKLANELGKRLVMTEGIVHYRKKIS